MGTSYKIITLTQRHHVTLLSTFSNLMKSRYDLPLIFRAKKSLKYFSIGTCRKIAGFRGPIMLLAGPNSESSLELQNVATDSLSFDEFTVALCSMLLYMPLLTICGGKKLHVIKAANFKMKKAPTRSDCQLFGLKLVGYKSGTNSLLVLRRLIKVVNTLNC